MEIMTYTIDMTYSFIFFLEIHDLFGQKMAKMNSDTSADNIVVNTKLTSPHSRVCACVPVCPGEVSLVLCVRTCIHVSEISHTHMRRVKDQFLNDRYVQMLN